MSVRKVGTKWVVYEDGTEAFVSMHRCKAEAEKVAAGMSAETARAEAEAARAKAVEEEKAKDLAEFVARENAQAEAKAKKLIAKEVAEAEEEAMKLAEARAQMEAEAMAATETKEPPAEDGEKEPQVGFACPHCDFAGKTELGLATHIRAKHPDPAGKGKF